MNIPDALCLLSAPASTAPILAPVDLLIVVPYFVLVLAVMLLDVSYVGSFSTHQIVEPNINQPTPNADVLAKRVSMESVRPYYGFGSITYRQMAGLLRYNSMQASLKRPVTKGRFLQSRFEAYNSMNHFSLTNPSTSFGTPNFGRIINKSNPRNVQMGLRLNF